MNVNNKNALKHEVENVFGRRIVSSGDCLKLSDEIFDKTQKRLNVNTLRRVFGLVKADYPPSRSTLNILSEYCGFQSAEDIYKLNEDKNDNEVINQDALWHYLATLFEISVIDKSDETFLGFVKNTIRFLNKNLSLTHKFQNIIAKTKSGQDFYFEQFVNIDMFNFYYCDGLRYYMNEKRTDEAMIFGHSILLYKHWLNNSHEKLLEHAGKLPPHIPNSFLNSYINCRYYAAKLFEAFVLSLPIDDILSNIYKFHSSLLSTSGNDQLFYFEYVISEALILTGRYNDAGNYLTQFENRSRKTDFCQHTLSLENIKLLKALAYLKTNNLVAAIDVFNNLKPADFHFTAKKFAGILYTHLFIELKRKSFKYGESFDSLIKETGFLRLETLYKPNIN